MRFARDRRRWLQWLFEAKKRFGTSILNYAVTSNHAHLLINDAKGREVIPQTMQLVAGRTGQEYNERKNRRGGFWEDRYHATAVETDSHLNQCMVYIDLNMVRAGVVRHPSEWPFCGYSEIQNPRQRYSLIDYESVSDLFEVRSVEEFQKAHKGWVEEAFEKESHRERQPLWTESIAVGSEAFVKETKGKLGTRARGRKVRPASGSFELREPRTRYETDFDLERDDLTEDNTLFWDVTV